MPNYLTKKKTAAKFSATERWVDLAVADGRLSPPVYFDTRFPRFNEDVLEEDVARALKQRPKTKTKA